jgi:arylamine N-acetyltransferase
MVLGKQGGLPVNTSLYFRRIKYEGSLKPAFTTLRALHLASGFFTGQG